jgi:hypothetical protein
VYEIRKKKLFHVKHCFFLPLTVDSMCLVCSDIKTIQSMEHSFTSKDERPEIHYIFIPEIQIPCPQKSSTRPCPEVVETILQPTTLPYFFKLARLARMRQLVTFGGHSNDGDTTGTGSISVAASRVASSYGCPASF